MKSKLKHICSLNTGLYRKPDPTGEAIYLTGKHFDEFGNLKKDALMVPEIQIDSNSHRHLLEDKDLLFIAKGYNNRACLYRKKYGDAIASSLFFVVRIEKNILLPEYLQWFINAPDAQNQLKQMAKGSGIRSISKKSFSELDVLVPSISIQRKILSVFENWQKEKKLLNQLLSKKDFFYQKTLLNFLKPNNHEI